MVRKVKLTAEQLLNAMQGSCGCCKHWERLNGGESGECHRYPPQILTDVDEEGKQGLFSVSPQTDLTDNCGEYKPNQ